MKILICCLSLLFFSCENEKTVMIFSQTIDSLRVENKQLNYTLDSLFGKYDTLKNKFIEQRMLILATKEQCRKYATITRKNPKNTVFIENWISRAFNWTEQ